jgi:hypothetical protein
MGTSQRDSERMDTARKPTALCPSPTRSYWMIKPVCPTGRAHLALGTSLYADVVLRHLETAQSPAGLWEEPIEMADSLSGSPGRKTGSASEGCRVWTLKGSHSHP